MRLAGTDNNHPLTLAESIQVGKDDIKSYKARPDLNYFSNAKIVTLPSDIALNLLEDETTYDLKNTRNLYKVTYYCKDFLLNICLIN
ncbi:hypothetical protein [Enterococcus thailandicus]|nr:hypothetical protein [Enterococcus thailandicus]